MTAAMADNVTQFRSIQAEQLEKDGGYTYTVAEDIDVDDFVSGATDEILQCRDAGHQFPARSRTRMEFSEVDKEGLFVRRTDCQSCGCAERIERWQPVGRGKNIRWTVVAQTIGYHPGPHGEKYVMKTGMGRALKRQIRESMATMALGGQTPASIRKELTAKAKAEEKDVD